MEAPLKDRRGREGCGHPVPAVEMSLSLVKSTLTRKQKRIFLTQSSSPCHLSAQSVII